LKATISPDQYAYGNFEHLEGYLRQYFGIMFQDGKPLIYANYFCEMGFDNWLEAPVFVLDGGECFFQLLYNPAANTYFDLRINGYA
jgi:hypothetical protein